MYVNRNQGPIFGSTTITETPVNNALREQKPVTSKQRAFAATLQNVNNFVEALGISTILPSQFKENLKSWKISYLDDFTHLNDEEEKFRAAQSLSFLYTDVILATMNECDEEELLDYEEALKGLIYPLLPDGFEEEYTEDLLAADQKTNAVVEEMAAIDNACWQEEQKAFDNAEKQLQLYHQHYVNMQNAYQGSNNSYQKQAAQLCKEQEKILKSISNTTHQTTTLHSKARNLSSELQNEEGKLNHLINEFEDLLNKKVHK